MRIVYGAQCTWWDTIDHAALAPLDEGACDACGKVHELAIPLACRRGERHASRHRCPHCGGRLHAVIDEPRWWAGVPTYPAIEWSRGQCFPDAEALIAAYRTRAEVPV